MSDETKDPPFDPPIAPRPVAAPLASARAGMNPPSPFAGGTGPMFPPEPPPTETERLTSIPSVEVRDRKRDDASFLELDDSTRDPNRYYRWVRLDDHTTSVAKRKRQGFRIERQQKGGVRTLAEPDPRPDNAIVIGDSILMSCPLELHVQRQQSHKRRREALLQSTTAETEQALREKGVTVIKDPDHNRTSIELRA